MTTIYHSRSLARLLSQIKDKHDKVKRQKHRLVVSQVVAGGAGGAILTAIIGAIKNKVAA